MARAQPPRDRSADDFHQRVRHVVGLLLAGGPIDVRRVAGLVRTSARTLQRRLHRIGLTYAEVVAQARLETARKMLDDPGKKIGDVARTLGYSDGAHFTRAFQRWTGLTPTDFRRRAETGRATGAAPTRRHARPGT
jgi:AraC-like DNA-binding protein